MTIDPLRSLPEFGAEVLTARTDKRCLARHLGVPALAGAATNVNQVSD
jgi:hypothetical protein